MRRLRRLRVIRARLDTIFLLQTVEYSFYRSAVGKKIAYVKPKIEVNRFGKSRYIYGYESDNKTWSRLETWGGKLVENIVQAFARDCLAESIIRLEDRGFKINFHVHDEVIVDVPKGVSSAEELAAIM